VWLCLAGGASAQERAPFSVASETGTVPTATAIRVEGDRTEDFWSRAQPIGEFVQREPAEGAAPSQRTVAKVAYDDEAIYVSVRAFDTDPSAIQAFLTRRDVPSGSDWIRVYIDSYHDRRTAYSFAVNPVGVKLDTYHYNDGNQDDSWDAVWDVSVVRDAEGWRAEFKIPLSQLRFQDGGDGRLGFAVARNLARTNETSMWPLISRGAVGWVSSFGDLTGVSRSAGVKRLELMPYALGQMRTRPLAAGDPLHQNPDPSLSLGADLKYAVTPALSLTASVNPDFGQVEADPAVVNLSAFEVFFQERRPFFIEGSGNYAFECRDCNLFYSRRIGRTPRGAPTLATGEFIARPDQSTILGAAKLTGRVGGFSLGVMAAATQEEVADIALDPTVASAGDLAPPRLRRREAIEPQTFYTVSRAKREFSDQSTLGFMLTTTNRQIPGELSFIPTSATTGGVDFDWRIRRRFGVNGYWAGSHIAGSTTAIDSLQRSTVHSFQRPDAGHVALDPLAETLRGHSGGLSFQKLAGQRTRGNVGIGYKSPGFDPNDVGFMRRADHIPQNAWLQVRFPDPGRFVRSLNINFNQWSSFNFDGDRLDLGYNFNAHWQFQNMWSTGFGVNYNTDGFDDRLTRGGPGGRTNGNINSWQYFNTNDRLLFSLAWNSNFGNDRRGSRWWSVEPRLVIRPKTAWSAEIGVGYNDSINDWQWVNSDTVGVTTHYVFGRLLQKTTTLTTRFNYTLTPTLSVQVYAQPFISAGVYDGYKELVQPKADYPARFAPYAYATDANFNVLSFRTTNVLRWEYKPGSAFFVVWQQGREGFTRRGSADYGRDFAELFDTPSSNTVLVKLAYWLNP
jgi:hypothetical protein